MTQASRLGCSESAGLPLAVGGAGSAVGSQTRTENLNPPAPLPLLWPPPASRTRTAGLELTPHSHDSAAVFKSSAAAAPLADLTRLSQGLSNGRDPLDTQRHKTATRFADDLYFLCTICSARTDWNLVRAIKQGNNVLFLLRGQKAARNPCSRTRKQFKQGGCSPRCSPGCSSRS